MDVRGEDSSSSEAVGPPVWTLHCRGGPASGARASGRKAEAEAGPAVDTCVQAGLPTPELKLLGTQRTWPGRLTVCKPREVRGQDVLEARQQQAGSTPGATGPSAVLLA